MIWLKRIDNRQHRLGRREQRRGKLKRIRRRRRARSFPKVK